MKKQSIVSLSLSAVVGGILLSACGDDVTKVTNVNEVSGMEVVASADSLGECDSGSIGKTVYASDENAAYVCADSGWMPLSQKASDGKSCVVEALSDSLGYKVVCGGDSVGVIKNGEDGSGCSLADNGDGTVVQVCGADTITLYKAFCAGKTYDPAKAYCFEDSAYSCGEKPYDPTREFCVEKEIYELCGGKVYDPSAELCDARDSTFYRYVVIGTQSWMAENLNYVYPKSDGEDSLSFCVDNKAANCEIYGRFYTWAAAMDSAAFFSEDGKDCGGVETCSASGTIRGVCPEGWHLPDTTEWNTLAAYVADNTTGGADSVGYALKSASGWNDYNVPSSDDVLPGGGSDAFGFNALPAGSRLADGRTDTFLTGASFWTSTEKREPQYYENAYFYYLYYSSAKLALNNNQKIRAKSVRCVKN